MRNQRNREDRDTRRNDIDDTRQGSRRANPDDMERSAGQEGSRRSGMNMPGSQSRSQSPSRSRKKK